MERIESLTPTAPEWPLHEAELLAAAGLPSVSGAPDRVLFSPGVDVRFGPRLR